MLTSNRVFVTVSTLVVVTAAMLSSGAPLAYAGGRDFVVYTTRLGGDTDTAQPYIDRFAARLESATGWPKGSLKGRFLATRKEALDHINTQKPGFGVLEPWLYFDLRTSHKLVPIGQIDSADLNSPRLHVLVKDSAIKTLDDLKGKRVWTHLADSPRYLTQVVLDGKEDAAKRFQIKQVGNVLKSVRAVLRGEADATLVDDEQLEAAKKIEGGASLRSVYDSPPLPPVVAVVFGGNDVPPKDQKELTKAVLEVCRSGEGAEVCKEMHIKNIVPISAALWTEAQKRYEAAGGGKK